jgi:hypothetical protein
MPVKFCQAVIKDVMGNSVRKSGGWKHSSNMTTSNLFMSRAAGIMRMALSLKKMKLQNDFSLLSRVSEKKNVPCKA